MSGTPIEIVRRSDGAFVKAELLDGLKPNDLTLIERAWTPARDKLMQDLLAKDVARADWPESLRWDWSKKAPELRLLETSGFGIVCANEWQGTMMTKTVSHTARLPDDRGKPLVYVDYLEVAPWNWSIKALARKGRYKLVGSLLMHKAVRQSQDEGFQGRMGLHSLPSAEQFYRTECGMTPVGRDRNKENLLYFEFSTAQAKEFLQDNGGAP